MRIAFLISLLMPFTASVCLGQVKTNSRAQISGHRPALKILSPVVSRIKRNTNVPVLLPSVLPRKWWNYRLYSYGESEANFWSIVVGTEPNCGANACSAGYLEGKRGEAPPKSDEVDEVVKLAGGTKGYFTAKSCGGSCTPPQINWIFKDVLYTIQFRVESKSAKEDEAVIIRMANSAIIGGPR